MLLASFRPRFTLRWLMVAVAMDGVGFEVPTWWRLSAEYRTKAEYYARAVAERREEELGLRNRPESPHSKEFFAPDCIPGGEGWRRIRSPQKKV